MLTFAESGFASNKLEKDYGEDFFVVTHATGGGTVEPFQNLCAIKSDRSCRWRRSQMDGVR